MTNTQLSKQKQRKRILRAITLGYTEDEIIDKGLMECEKDEKLKRGRN